MGEIFLDYLRIAEWVHYGTLKERKCIGPLIELHRYVNLKVGIKTAVCESTLDLKRVIWHYTFSLWVIKSSAK